MRLLLALAAAALVGTGTAQEADSTLLRIAKDHKAKSECKELERVLAPLLRREPPDVEALLLRSGCGLRNQEDVQRHLRTMQDLLDQDPRSYTVLMVRGDLYNDLRMFDRAEADLSMAVDAAPDSAALVRALNARAWNRLQTMKHAEARADCERALALDSVSVAAINNMALAANGVGDTALAFRMLKTLVRLKPDDTVGYINTGFFLGGLGRHQEALAYYDDAERHGAKDSRFFNNRGFSRIGVGDLKGARKDIERSIDLNKNNPYAYRNLAHLELAAKHAEAACAAMERALELGFTRMYGEEMTQMRRTHCN